MKVITATDHSIPKTPSVVTIGTFDGVHIGHQKIIKKLTKKAADKNLISVVLTFFPHPRMVLQQNSNIKLLNTIAERKEILAALGLNFIYVQEFTTDFANLTAREFVKTILVDQLKAKYVIIGYDHHFGKNRAANIDDLRAFGIEFDFEVEEISAQDVEDVAVSSTKIRNALKSGDIQTATAFLGYNYYINGTVVKGKGFGKKMEFPTANIQVDEVYKLIPKNGVYVVSSMYKGKVIYGMMNIGMNPTFEADKKTIEAHFFDFNQDLYGQDLNIIFLDRLRDEQKFESAEALMAQLIHDRTKAQQVIAALNA
ncbi:riboflavin kinase/FMN adenylyltransferase [Gelidibacter algens]|uniref:Riboflavin biosynthesis protein n=1 Tax=Gelidibacter algens TaxID=49280 RepID=A0A1A7R6J5_9FLAO|nr:bifunctional riboflavin kinase/FAD synthetase [Gelidibacter algens]OBX26372.1 riboflavin biosynthesis protein RibF [Gelidibacter algens]RAJ25886.1 riboflavin kinase/FMN adenylyltransferase [Gelidibacter algens]